MIKSGKCYQQQIDLKHGREKIKYDFKTLRNSLGTSTVGLIMHLNKNLDEMVAKSDSKQADNLAVIRQRFEHSITVQTLPIKQL